jgi:hypothetical protein
MARVLFIDDSNRQLSMQTALEILRLENHSVQGAYWDRGVFGKIPGTIKGKKPAHFINRIKPEVLFIHIGTNLDVATAQQVIAEVMEKNPDMRVVIITHMDPNQTFGAQYSLQLPYDPEDMIALAKI